MSDRLQLLRTASSLPVGHPRRKAILAALSEIDNATSGFDQVASEKVAFDEDSEDFVEWCLTQEPMSASNVQRFLEGKLGREPTAPSEGAARKSGPLLEGETVLVDSTKNKNPLNTDACDQYHNRVGVVKNINEDGLTIALYQGNNDRPSTELSGDVQFFSGFASGAKTGLMRWTPRTAYIENAVGKKVMFEIVYSPGGTAIDTRRVDVIEEYVDKGTLQGQSRSRMYYTGMVGKFAFNAKGELYFTMSLGQRDTPTTFNPKIGDVLYIGLLGKRPGGWKADAIAKGLRIP